MNEELLEELNVLRIKHTHGRYSPNIELRNDLWEQLRYYLYYHRYFHRVFNGASKYNHFICFGVEIRPFDGPERMRVVND